jgi:hypothetical protein
MASGVVDIRVGVTAIWKTDPGEMSNSFSQFHQHLSSNFCVTIFFSLMLAFAPIFFYQKLQSQSVTRVKDFCMKKLMKLKPWCSWWADQDDDELQFWSLLRLWGGKCSQKFLRPKVCSDHWLSRPLTYSILLVIKVPRFPNY